MENIIIKNKPKAILFDLNSLILDFNTIEFDYVNKILIKYGKPKLSKDNSIKFTKESFKSYFGEELFEKSYEEFNTILIDNIPKLSLINGIEKLFTFIQENKINLILIYDNENSFVEKFLEIFNLKKYFNEIINNSENNNIKKYLDEIDFEPLDENIINVGNNIESLKHSFRYSLIPILFIGTNNENDILIKNMNNLSKINNNPITIIKNTNELIELFTKAKQQWKEIEIQKITYIGANGKIGKHAINMICSNIPEKESVELVLLGSGSQNSLTRLQGLKKDIKGSLIIQNKYPKVKFIITNDWNKIQNSNIVICCAGRWPTEKEIEEFKDKDPSNRLIQSFVNAKMIIELSQKINKFCPKTLVLIVTNQVDMMCHIARNHAKDLNFIGLSGSVDSTRFKQKIKDIMGIESEALMIGFHNSTMIPIIKSLKNKDGKNIFPLLSKEIVLEDKDLQKEFEEVEKQKLKEILEVTRTMGIVIATEQKAGLDPLKNYGAAILPALAITKLINAYCFGVSYVESYNTFISDPKVAEHYGIECNSALSIPLRITKGKIEQLMDVSLQESEKIAMKDAQNLLREDLKLILGEEYV